VVALVASEAVVFGGAAVALPRGSLGVPFVLDVARALGAAALTALLFSSLPPLPIYAGVPACVLAFGACAFALGLLRPDDVRLLQTLLPAKAKVAIEGSPGSPAA